MELFLHQFFAGIATGGIYACIALSVVMIYQAIDHFNFAQGEMAMFSTFVAWQAMNWGLPYPVALVVTVVLSFIAGILLERIVFKPLHDAPVLSHIVVFIALFSIFNSVAGFLWDYTIKPFPSPFPKALGTPMLGAHEVGMILVTLVLLLLVFVFFRYTRLGLAMRAAAQNPASAKLVGVRVGWMIALGWGLATAIGAVAGIMIAPMVFLEPNMMLGIILYGLAGAVVGGLTSPGGAVLGGFFMGVLENIAGTYVPVIGGELKLSIALIVIVAVLMVKPSGLFGRTAVSRV